MMAIELYEHQKIAIEKLKSGSILCGGVGSGKSRTALAYYLIKECGGKIKINGVGGYAPMKKPKDLYIITTARKRDTLEWEQECAPFLIYSNREHSTNGVKVVVDSWNNISKYVHVKDAFFIFDEQRVVGSGKWVKAFLKISAQNGWLLLSATPGDTWMDYVPIFVANGFYKNRTEFLKKHVIYSNFSKYPKIDRYVEVAKLIRNRDNILVHMKFQKKTIAKNTTIRAEFDSTLFNTILKRRWNPYKEQPVHDVSELCYLLRKVVNSDRSRLEIVRELFEKHGKLIIFYNFDYELKLLEDLGKELNISMCQWNGHKHEEVPESDRWIYLVQYYAGAEAWNCIKTDTIVFYSQSYSYKMMVQAAGRIDRLNTPFTELYYYYLSSWSMIDLAIQKSLDNKKNFNESRFLNV